MTDIPGELEDLRSRMRVLEGGYRRNDRQSQLQRLGQGPPPQNLALGERQDSRMGQSSGFNLLGGAAPWHGQANLLIDPTLETLEDTTVTLGASPAVDGEWEAWYEVNSGDVPTLAELSEGYARADVDNNPFNTAVALIQMSWLAGDESDTDVYLQPITDLTPTAIPTLPYLTASVRLFTNWTYLQTIDDVEVFMQLVDPSGPTVIAESQAGPLTQAEQWQQWISASYDPGVTDWLWRLRVHITKEVTALDANLNIGIGEPMLSFTYTPDPVPFQPIVAAWTAPGLITGQLLQSGVITVNVTSDQDDWNPPGLAHASVIRFTGTLGVVISSIVAQPNARIMLISLDGNTINFGTGAALGTPTNRFLTYGNISALDQIGEIYYDVISQRWWFIR